MQGGALPRRRTLPLPLPPALRVAHAAHAHTVYDTPCDTRPRRNTAGVQAATHNLVGRARHGNIMLHTPHHTRGPHPTPNAAPHSAQHAAMERVKRATRHCGAAQCRNPSLRSATPAAHVEVDAGWCVSHFGLLVGRRAFKKRWAIIPFIFIYRVYFCGEVFSGVVSHCLDPYGHQLCVLLVPCPPPPTAQSLHQV